MHQDIALTFCALPQQPAGNGVAILPISCQKPLQMGLFSVPLHPERRLNASSNPV